MVITDLKTLIRELTYIYNTQGGNLHTVIMRDGMMFPEIELTVDNDMKTVFIEAYKKEDK